MLKKAGILVAATAAGLLAVSPLAFAGDKGNDWGHEGGHDETSVYYEDDDDNENSLVDTEIEDSSVNNCENDQASDDSGAAGVGALLGAASLLNGNNVNALQCNNVLNNNLNENDVFVDVL